VRETGPRCGRPAVASFSKPFASFSKSIAWNLQAFKKISLAVLWDFKGLLGAQACFSESPNLLFVERSNIAHRSSLRRRVATPADSAEPNDHSS
jgi:hypothetical protein